MKLLFVGFLGFILSFPLFAQWKVGIQGSGLLAKENYEDATTFDTEVVVGYSAHLFLERRFTPVFGLSFEPGYLEKGGKVTIDNVVVSGNGASAQGGVTFTNKVGYLSIPVLANLHILNVVSISAGPEFSAKLSETYTSSNPDISARAIYEDAYNNLEMSGLVGIFVSPLPKLKTGLRYSFALSNTAKIDEENLRESAAKAQYLQLMVRLVFN